MKFINRLNAFASSTQCLVASTCDFEFVSNFTDITTMRLGHSISLQCYSNEISECFVLRIKDAYKCWNIFTYKNCIDTSAKHRRRNGTIIDDVRVFQ